MDLANPLMGSFDKVSTLRVADDDSGMQDLYSGAHLLSPLVVAY